MSEVEAPDLSLSCWIVEAARSTVLQNRGHRESGVRAAEKARILARVCAAEGVKILPRTAGEHAEWMAQVAGAEAETGPLGRVFLQRLGIYVDAHMRGHMPQHDHERMQHLSTLDLDEVNEALSIQGLPEIPEDDWPPAPDDAGKKAENPDRDLLAERSGTGEIVTRFGIMADPHIEPADNLYVEQALRELKAAGVAFTIVPGDITKDGEPACYKEALRILQGSTPVLCTLGNHDMAAGGLGPDLFEAGFGMKPYGEYELDGVRVILLDSAVRAVSPFPPFDIMGGDFTDAPAESVPWGDFSQEMTDWMSGLSASKHPTFVFLHHPPYPYPGFPPLVFGLGNKATQKLADLVEATNAAAIFCGHTHRSARRIFEGVPVIELPSARHWPFAFGTVEIGRGNGGESGWWSFNLCPVPERPGKAAHHAGYLFRRYAAGDKKAHSYSARL